MNNPWALVTAASTAIEKLVAIDDDARAKDAICILLAGLVEAFKEKKQ